MPKIDKPHDKLFKGYMGDVENAIDFAKHYFPKEILEIIDIQTMHPEKDSFVTGELKEVFSDLLFSVDILGETGKIYILFEHKSYSDGKVGFQLLKAMVMIWDKVMNPTKKSMKKAPTHLPVIIPLVFYHGKRTWKLSPKFQKMYQRFEQLPTVLQKLLPDFQYLLYDFSNEKKTKILGNIIHQIYIGALHLINEEDPQKVLEQFRHIMELIEEIRDFEQKKKWIEMLFEYLLQMPDTIEVEEMLKISESIGKERGKMMPTIAEKLRKEGRKLGLQEGRKKGLQEGLEEGRKEFAEAVWIHAKSKFEKISDTYKQKIQSLSTAQLKTINTALFKMDSWEQLDKYLPE